MQGKVVVIKVVHCGCGGRMCVCVVSVCFCVETCASFGTSKMSQVGKPPGKDLVEWTTMPWW